MSKLGKKLIKALEEGVELVKEDPNVLEEKVRAIQSIRDAILAAWATVDLDSFEKSMMATSAAAVCVNIIEATVKEDVRRQTHGKAKS